MSIGDPALQDEKLGLGATAARRPKRAPTSGDVHETAASLRSLVRRWRWPEGRPCGQDADERAHGSVIPISERSVPCVRRSDASYQEGPVARHLVHRRETLPRLALHRLLTDRDQLDRRVGATCARAQDRRRERTLRAWGVLPVRVGTTIGQSWYRIAPARRRRACIGLTGPHAAQRHVGRCVTSPSRVSHGLRPPPAGSSAGGLASS